MAESAVDPADIKATKKKTEDASTKKELKLTELRVTDLRTELENRGLDKTGVKAALVERLKKSLEDEGKNPDDILFEVAVDVPVAKKSKRIKESLSESKSSDADNVETEQDSEDNEDEEEKHNDDTAIESGENNEILQLSLDDKEANLDSKENADIQDKSADAVENAGELVATEKVQESDKNETVIDDSEEVNDKTTDKGSESPEKTGVTPKAKVPVKSPAKTVTKDDASKTAQTKNIWITGLSSTTRAVDLKSLFSKQGKVLSVKIVTNAKQVSGDKKYYGFITMSTTKDASKAVENLNNTELNEHAISLELTQHQPGTLLKKSSAKPGVKKIKAIGEAAKAAVSQKVKKDAETKEREESQEKDDKSARKEKDREHRSREPREYRDYRPPFRRPFGFRGRGRGRGFSFRERPPMEMFRRPFGRKPFFGRMSYRPPMKPRFMGYKMRDDRMSRDRYREREMRESERRREEAFHHKMIERKHREEAYRLEREKVQLRIEREMLERERAEILKLERDKQRLERERLEREREKLRRQTQMRELQKRPFPGPPDDTDSIWEKEKRARHYEGSRYPNYAPKPPGMDGRQDYREPPQVYNRHKFEPRQDHYERESHTPTGSRPDFKYGKDKVDVGGMRDHDERRVYKRNYFKEDQGRPYPPREAERYPPPRDDRFKPKIHDMRSPRSRGGGGGGRRMPYY